MELVRLINQFQEADVLILQQALDNGVPFEQISQALFKYGDITEQSNDDALLSAFTQLLKGIFKVLSCKLFYSNLFSIKFLAYRI